MTIRPPLLSLGLLSASLLAYEISLMHLFAIIQYHHFAYMIISLALLGYGSSGTFLAIFQDRLRDSYRGFYLVCVVLFSTSALISFLLAQKVPFNGLELFWDIRQTFYLGLLFLLLFLPFFFGASAIGMTLAVCRQRVPVIYGADLLGAGTGSLLILVLLWLLMPDRLLVAISGMGLVAAAFALVELSVSRPALKGLGLFAIFALLAVIGGNCPLQPTPYKPLQQYQRIAGTKITMERASPLGLVQVLESEGTPLRYAPGMSLVTGREPPAQKGIFVSGDGMSVITRMPGRIEQLHYLQQMTSALPYHLNKPKNVLILGIGGGQDILQARFHRPEKITAVELNPQIVDLLAGEYAEYSGNLLEDTKVHIGDMRGFITKSRERFDVIQVALVDSFFPSASGLYALRENYLYTVEALRDYIGHLSPEGYLAITRWVKNPPRDSLKLLATAMEALHGMGVVDAGRHLALIRGWQTSTLIVKGSALSRAEIEKIVEFCRIRAFDIVYSFATGEDQANRYNIMADATFTQAARAITGVDSADFIARYKYNLQPASDDRPYFHHFFKWSALREFFQLRESGGASLLESGYLILLTVLMVAVVFSLLLILAPLALVIPQGHRFHLRRRAAERSFDNPSHWGGGGICRLQVVAYFFFVGVAFLLIEIACIQKSVLFLDHPVYAVSTVIAAFLVFGGLGSLAAQRLADHPAPEELVRRAIYGIVLICLCYLLLLGKVFALASDLGLPGRITVVATVLGPLAFFMGMPFPLALSYLSSRAAYLVPWAWGINGCGSVISSMLATILAIHFGFNAVLVVAMLLYLVVAWCFPVASPANAKVSDSLEAR
ncbi:MAG: hypothetical protein OEL83_01180 [Desulforhopalus sp.]|nr:hypothetical protein [Desulforhopalus sp.]